MKTLQHLPQKISILLVVVELVSAGRITWYCSSERKIGILGLIENVKQNGIFRFTCPIVYPFMSQLRNATCDQKWRQHFRDGMRRQICLPRGEALVIIIIIVILIITIIIIIIVIIKIFSFMVMRNSTYKCMYTQFANVLSISHYKV